MTEYWIFLNPEKQTTVFWLRYDDSNKAEAEKIIDKYLHLNQAKLEEIMP